MINISVPNYPHAVKDMPEDKKKMAEVGWVIINILDNSGLNDKEVIAVLAHLRTSKEEMVAENGEH